MGAIKTAISLDRELFEQAEEIAREMKVSRSKLFVLALEDFIEQKKNKDLLDRINAANAEEPDEAEQVLRFKTRAQHRRLVEDEW